jgi:serine/threonine protein kinase
MTELVGVMVGQYFLLEYLGREGIVETYRARPTTQGGYDVVLRLFRPQFPDPSEFHKHFAAEAEKVWRCHHEHIQPLLEFGMGDELLYSATLSMQVETLEQFLERPREGFLPINLVLRLVTQLCAALQHAHEQGIVHGNIQPSSILMQDEEHVLLTNFSMRRAYQPGDAPVAHIGEGNPAYTAPEQSLGMPRPASDIYALGVLLYRLLGGCLPYDGENPGEIALKHTEEPIPSLCTLRPEVPEALEMVVRVALAKSPDARFPSVAALAHALLSAVVPGASPIVTVLPRRRIVLNPRYSSFTWTRASSVIALFVLLFGLASTLLFVFTPLQHSGVSNWLFNNGDRSLIPGVVTTPAASVTSTSPPEAVTPTPGDSGPITGPARARTTPTPGQSQTPVPDPTANIKPAPSPGVCSSASLSIDGSPNLQPMLRQVDSDYLLQCPGLAITLGAHGSSIALKSLRRHLIDIADTDLTARQRRGLADHLVGALLYAVIVSPDVQVADLSSAALRGIYHGQITNWAQLGGPDEPIRIVLRSPCSAITAIFRAFVLGDVAASMRGIKPPVDLSNDVVPTVARVPGAISYVSLLEAQNANVHVLSIDGTAPGLQGLSQGTYQFWSIEHLYTLGEGTSQAQDYIQFLTSTQEMAVMLRYDVVPLNILQQNTIASHLPGPTDNGSCS